MILKGQHVRIVFNMFCQKPQRSQNYSVIPVFQNDNPHILDGHVVDTWNLNSWVQIAEFDNSLMWVNLEHVRLVVICTPDYYCQYCINREE